MKEIKHKRIRETISHAIDIYSFEGKLEDIVARLQSIPDTYSQYSDFQITLEVDYEYTNAFLSGERDETDAERKKRLKNAQEQREFRKAEKLAVEERQRELYEKLKEKFEKK